MPRRRLPGAQLPSLHGSPLLAAPPRRVLVIEADAGARLSLEQLIAADGHQVGAADSGTAAVTLMDRWAPDVVLLDLTLPRADLTAAMTRVRAFDPQPPVIGVSHRDSSRPRQRLELAGCLFKPFHTGAVRAAVRRALGMSAQPAGGPPPKRAHRRLSVALDTVVLSPEGQRLAQGKILNLSVGGAQPHLDSRLEVGARVVMGFQLPGRGIVLRLPARVQWRNPATQGFAFGVQFEEVAPDVGRALETVIGAASR
jgi:CheY-like chemotaxis protein